MRTLVIWGAGRIGRGFVAEIFREAEFAISFVDIDRALVDALERADGYTVALAEKSGIRKVNAPKFYRALHTSETAQLEALFEAPELLLDIAVHQPKLSEVAGQLTPLFERRALTGLPMDVMMNVNMAGPDEAFRVLMRERLSERARAYFDEKVGVTGIFAMCISPVAPAWLIREDPLALWNNGWREQAISLDALKCAPPKAPRLRVSMDIAREETRKLYTLNMAHALLCYLGLPKGHRTALEAVRDEAILAVLKGALSEASLGLQKRFGFAALEMESWQSTIVELLENPYIEDALCRLGADSRRKLGGDDRLCGPARLCRQAGGSPVNLALAIRAGFEYENDDEGTREVRAFYKANGLEAALQRYCGLRPGDGLFELVTGGGGQKP